MITIFTIPKAFQGHIALIQRNAIQSWLKLSPACQIILCGDDPGVAEAASEFGIEHLPHIERNQYGTPLLSSAYQLAQQAAKHDFTCYTNGDIIFLSDLVQAVQKIPFQQFLMLGQRRDINITEALDFTRPDWEQSLRLEVARHGTLRRFDYIDYFLFPTHTITDLPDFAVGRPGWDNWLIYHLRALGRPVIDATQAVMAVHQNHDYTHVPMAKGQAWEGPEADHNRLLMGGKEHRFYVTDATYQLTDKGLSKALGDVYLERRASRQPVLDTGSGVGIRFKHRVIAWVGRRRSWFPGWIWRHFIDMWAK